MMGTTVIADAPVALAIDPRSTIALAAQCHYRPQTSLEKRNPWNALASLARPAQRLAMPGACEKVRQGRVDTRGRLMRHPLGLSYPASIARRSR